jgi:hypothetical protein
MVLARAPLAEPTEAARLTFQYDIERECVYLVLWLGLLIFISLLTVIPLQRTLTSELLLLHMN